MNLNIIGYFIYLGITVFIILKVGKICYRNGNIYVAELIPNHADICQKINQVLLLAYYLLNIGYCAMTLISWQKIAPGCPPSVQPCLPFRQIPRTNA